MDVDFRIFRENYLKAVNFDYPWFIPSFVSIPPPTWRKYREKLEKIVEKHRLIFPGFRRGMINYDIPTRPSFTYKDEWGCVWRYTVDGLQGIVVEAPLKDWSKLKDLKIPDPELGLPREGEPPIPWSDVETLIGRVKSLGGLTIGFMPHGFLFLRLTYLRGYLNFLRDLVTQPPQLEELISIVTEYNVEVVKKLVRLGVDIISFGDDLGIQKGFPYPIQKFRQYILPSYKRIFSEAKRKGAKVRLHTDGYVMDIAEDIVSSGVDVLNIQENINRVEVIKNSLKGKVAIDVDVDRQRLLPFGTPREIDTRVKRIIQELSFKRGGLLFTAEVLQDVPLSNIEALLNALEKHSKLHLECS